MTTYPASVDQVWLFGSAARQTATADSDVDILVVSEDEPAIELREMLTSRFGRQLDIAHYTYGGLARIIDKPSLFASHLQREGIALFSRTSRLADMLADMPAYGDHIEDLRILQALLDETMTSLEPNTSNLIFEYGVVGTIARNTGIIMTHYVGKADYSTAAPMTLSGINSQLALPLTSSQYYMLQQCRRAGERGTDTDGISPDVTQLLNFCRNIRSWQQDCIRSMEDHQ